MARLTNRTLGMTRAGVILRAAAVCATVLFAGATLQGGNERDTSALLEQDPGILSGSLRNGVTYVIVPRQNGGGRDVAVRVRIGAGTLDERDDELGAAHLVGRLVFTRSAHFEEGEARRRFAAHGMEFDRLQSVYTRHGETVYAFGISDAGSGALELALQVGADAVGGVIFDNGVVEKERRLSIEDARLFSSESRDARSMLFERLVPGSGLGERPTLVDPGTLEQIDVRSMAAYHKRNFTPERTTVVLVGEIDGGAGVRAIARAFGDLKPRESGTNRERWRVAEGAHERAISSAIQGEPETTVEVLVASSAAGAVRTERDFKESVVRDLAIEAMRTRLRRGVLDGSFGAREVAANAWDFVGVARVSGVSAITSGDGWVESVHRLNNEIERVRRDGFEAVDVRGARARVVAQTRREARSARSRTNGRVASWVLSRVRMGSTVLSRQREYELTAQIAGLTEDEAIGRAFAEIFAAGSCCTVVVGATGTVPDESTIVQAIDHASGRVLADAREAAGPLPAIDFEEGERGGIVSIEYDPATGMTSAVFANGVIVHHKKVESAVNRVVIGVALAGGRSQENGSTRGYTSAAAAVWDAPAWCGTSVAAVDTALAGRDIKFDGAALDDSMQVTAECDPGEVRAALGVMSSTIHEPLIEAGALRRWRETVTAEAVRRRSSPGWMLGDVFVRATHRADDPRYGMLDGEDAARVELGGAQRWAEEFMDRAPIEATIIGDIERRDALDAAAGTLGMLPARDRIDAQDSKHDDESGLVRGSIEVHTTCDASADHAMVLVGYRGVGYTDRESYYQINVLGNVWEARLAEVLQEEEQLASWVGCGVSPGVSHDASGMIWAAAAVRGEEIERVGERMLAVLGEIHERGVRDEELEGARQQALDGLRVNLDNPRHLALLSCDMRYRGLGMADELRAEESILSCDAWRLRELLNGLRDDDRRVVLTIRPEKEPQSR